MKKQVAEYLKLMSALGTVHGVKVGIRKNMASGTFSVQLPGMKQKTWIRKGTSDWMAFKQIFIWKEYEYPIAFIPSTILDAGANVGYAAQWFARRFPGASIVSLEPETSNFTLLERNTADYKNVHLIQAGLWGRNCFLRIIPSESGNWAFRTEEVDSPASDTIKALTVTEVMQTRGWETIDLFKMDIEGAEKNVFASDAGNWLPKVKVMFLELHDNIDRDCSKNVFRALLEHDFSVDITGENIVLFNNRFR
jgi:FkbM family methyltransferase